MQVNERIQINISQRWTYLIIKNQIQYNTRNISLTSYKIK